MGSVLRTGSNSRATASRDLRDGVIDPSAHRQAERFFASLTWVTPLIIGANVLVFAAMAVIFTTVKGFTPLQLAVWGGNSGTLDLAGQWWRLVTYQFLHANLLHIAVNMVVLWNFGRLTERLYGSVILLFLYLASGALAGLASIVWNPEQVSVGASGSIFGVVGALLAFLLRVRGDAPASVLRLWVPALVFTGYNLFAGANEPGVDNACHVGGLIAGFSLGLILATPLDSRPLFSFARSLAAILLAGLCALLPLWYLGAFNHRPTTVEAFAATHQWYVDGESTNLQLWGTLAAQIASGTISNDEAENRFEKDVLPFWKDAKVRLRSEASARGGSENPFLNAVAEFAAVRLDWAQAIIASLRDNNPENARAILVFAQQAALEQAALDRLKLRAEADGLPDPLNQSAIALWLRSLIPGFQQQCVDAPVFVRKALSPSDAVDDGPAQRRAMGCLAQRLFLTGDYATLDATMKKYSHNPADLPDGSSRLEGMWRGLDDLFAYGHIAVEEAMRRESQWRRDVKGSVEPDLAEAEMFRDWAYAARGYGYASSVSPQAMQLYMARSAMAAAGLRDTAATAASNPTWYVLSLAVDRDQSVPVDKQRAVFDQGAARFPGYLPLYTQMLTSLMPRWGGSTNAVDSFIRDASKTTSGQIDATTYARLYVIYGNLEGDDYNSLESSSADTAILKRGVDSLRTRYPNSDYITNAVARFKCIDNDVPAYRALRPSLNGHQSATAWPDKMSVTSCDKFAS